MTNEAHHSRPARRQRGRPKGRRNKPKDTLRPLFRPHHLTRVWDDRGEGWKMYYPGDGKAQHPEGVVMFNSSQEDRNGTPIFAGDLIALDPKRVKAARKYGPVPDCYLVAHQPGKFLLALAEGGTPGPGRIDATRIDPTRVGGSLDVFSRGCQVVGNLFENPDLLDHQPSNNEKRSLNNHYDE